MHIRRALAAAAVLLPLGTVLAIGGTAQAAGTPKATGSITCALGGNATFTPPLTTNGTPGYKHEFIQFHLDASSCSGPAHDTPQPVSTSAAITTKPVKVPDIGKGKSKVAGACGNSDFNPTVYLKGTAAWSGGAPVAGTKLDVGPLMSTSSQSEPGLTGSGPAKKSYFGTATITLYITPASEMQLAQACGEGGAGGRSRSWPSTTPRAR